MRFRDDTERAIYAACFVARLDSELSQPRPAWFTPIDWRDRAVDIAIGDAINVVQMHRDGVKRRAR